MCGGDRNLNSVTATEPTNADKASLDDWYGRVDPNQKSWQFAWAILWTSCPEEQADLIQKAEAWLLKVRLDHGGWQYVWHDRAF
jgi:hypothetical protein